MVLEISPKDLINWINFLLPDAFSITKDTATQFLMLAKLPYKYKATDIQESKLTFRKSHG